MSRAFNVLLSCLLSLLYQRERRRLCLGDGIYRLPGCLPVSRREACAHVDGAGNSGGAGVACSVPRSDRYTVSAGSVLLLRGHQHYQQIGGQKNRSEIIDFLCRGGNCHGEERWDRRGDL